MPRTTDESQRRIRPAVSRAPATSPYRRTATTPYSLHVGRCRQRVGSRGETHRWYPRIAAVPATPPTPGRLRAGLPGRWMASSPSSVGPSRKGLQSGQSQVGPQSEQESDRRFLRSWLFEIFTTSECRG